MNWLDWLLVIVILLPAAKGLRSGFLAGVAGIAGLMGGIWLAVNYHRPLAGYLITEWNWDQKIPSFLFSNLGYGFQTAAGGIINMAAFLLIVVFVYLMAGIVLRLFARSVDGTVFSPFDKLGGLLLGLIKGGIFAVMITIFFTQINTGFLILALQKSQIATIVINLMDYLDLPVLFWEMNI